MSKQPKGEHLPKPERRPSAQPRWVYAYQLEPPQPDARFQKIKTLLTKAHVAARRGGARRGGGAGRAAGGGRPPTPRAPPPAPPRPPPATPPGGPPRRAGRPARA